MSNWETNVMFKHTTKPPKPRKYAAINGANPVVFQREFGISGRCTLCSTKKNAARSIAPTMIKTYV
jgi:hypothetical protein